MLELKMIQEYLAKYPGATFEEIACSLGLSKQRQRILLKFLATTTQKEGKDYQAETLTEGETRILYCIVDGMTNLQMAETLGVGQATIKKQVTVILGKLNANNRAHAVALAVQRGLISLDGARVAKTPPSRSSR
jgi:DNA-binding NarL/FixJ family response regulator